MTDGETRDGLRFSEVEKIFEGIRIPIYTIGYDANISELQRLSAVVEAASIQSDPEDVAYQIGSLLNAQM